VWLKFFQETQNAWCVLDAVGCVLFGVRRGCSCNGSAPADVADRFLHRDGTVVAKIGESYVPKREVGIRF
jgi:hypothetical protein